MSHFVTTAKSQGLRLTHNRLSRAKSVLVPVSIPESILEEWKRRNQGYVVQRLDGLFYDPETSAYNSEKNHDAKMVYDEFADAIIFQSEYSRKQCLHFWQEPRAEVKTALIENGTDLNTFQPRMADWWTPEKKVRFISTGNFRDPEMVIPILEALDEIKREDSIEFSLELVGPVANAAWVEDKARDYLQCCGSLPTEQVAEKLAQSDIFLFSFLNPNCPNSVIEATAAGLPVVGFDGGSMRELCGFNAELLANVGDHLIHQRPELLERSSALVEKIRLCLSDYPEFRERALSNRARFDIESVVQRYIEVIRQKV